MDVIRLPRAVAPLLVASWLFGAADPAAALETRPCAGQPLFVCGSVTVPLDRSGATPGALRLRVAALRRARGQRGVVLALSGGPGQGSVDVASSFLLALDPILRRRRLVVFDQRGTGRSGGLSCPSLQRLGALDAVPPVLVRACADRLGARRTSYTTADSVADIETLRTALGVPRLTLAGISYGTYVAIQYARAYPQRVERLILDSVVGPEGIDAFLLDSYARVDRVLREQCAARRCRRITPDPVADVRALTGQLATAPLHGTRFDARGRRQPTALRSADELFLLLLAGDLNPYLQPALPAAIAAARAGDRALLLRLRRIGNGAPTRTRDLSLALNVVTTCADVRLPYTFMTPIEQRGPLVDGALGAIAPEVADPLGLSAVRSTSLAEDCLLWPEGDRPAAPSAAPLPDVPALLLGGRLDLRTPAENADALAELLPRAQVVKVPGSGHDVLDTDLSGCVTLALRRFWGERRMGRPCRGAGNQIDPFPRPPRTLRAVAPARGVRSERGRVVAAVLDTVVDARVTALQSLYAGYRQLAGGGLRAGSFSCRRRRRATAVARLLVRPRRARERHVTRRSRRSHRRRARARRTLRWASSSQRSECFGSARRTARALACERWRVRAHRKRAGFAQRMSHQTSVGADRVAAKEETRGV